MGMDARSDRQDDDDVGTALAYVDAALEALGSDAEPGSRLTAAIWLARASVALSDARRTTAPLAPVHRARLAGAKARLDTVARRLPQ